MDLDSAAIRLLWAAIKNELETSRLSWRDAIDRLGQVAAVERREAGASWTDGDVLEALTRAVLSNNTDWKKVETVLPELREAFSDFDLEGFAARDEEYVDTTLVPWFKQRRAGSMTMAGSLKGLLRTARVLSAWSRQHGSAESYFLDVLSAEAGDVKRAAVALGKPSSPKKLPALGVPIAAESLRNLGFDLAKPDRHVCRAVGSFGLVRFHNWPDTSGNRAPQAGVSEQLQTMAAIAAVAKLVGERCTFVDNAVWLLCSRTGLGMSNASLASLSGGFTGAPGRRVTPTWLRKNVHPSKN